MQIYISYKQNITYLNIAHVIPSLFHVTSHHNTTRLIPFRSIHVLKDQNIILLNQSISINTQALCNKYTKTQSYMQCGTMLVKNLIERLRVHEDKSHTDKLDHSHQVKSQEDQSRSHCSTRMLQPCGIDTDLKKHSKWVYLPPRPTLQRVR